MEHAAPVSALFGGALIGLAAVVLMWLNGQVAGVSGIAAGLLAPDARAEDRGWRIAFVVGLVVAPLALTLFGGDRPQIDFGASTPIMAAAGILVGFGSALGGGCTSGHGVCGIARLSPRSLVATATFMSVAVATTYVMRHMMGG